DPKINLSEFLQILCETGSVPPLFLGWDDEPAEERGAEFGGGKAREIFLYQKIILLASKKSHSCRNT
ncbi:hypothetical protein, partial [Leptospira sp. P2653]|uniref:hypothetical protein n=1 Tax=Leptospira sp. P2653 TaxID=1218600 RepID=UPI00056948B5